jgi:hypothetical protein
LLHPTKFAQDVVAAMTKASPHSVIKPVSLSMKHDFVAVVLADKLSRNKRRPRLTAFDGAVITVLVTHVNSERGYSFIGSRAIAKKLAASPAGVAKSIGKLKSLGIFDEVDGAKRNRAARLVPNWAKFMDLSAYGIDEGNAVHGMSEGSTVHGINENMPTTAMAVDKTVKKRTRKGANGTGRASLARAAASPNGLDGSAREARQPRQHRTAQHQTASDLLKRRKERRDLETKR